MRCLWCHNPESVSGHQELKFIEDKCIKCGKCSEVCPEGAITVTSGASSGKWTLKKDLCTSCGICVSPCPAGALDIWGEETSARKLTDELMKDRDYFWDSGGGITFSGGEALLQNEFLCECLTLLKEQNIQTAVDTALAVEWESVEKILDLTNLILLDIKGLNPETHQDNTGIRPSLIFDNIAKLKALPEGQGPDIIVRIPLIKDLNIEVDRIPELIALLGGWSSLKRIEILPYHSMGVDKASQLVLSESQKQYAPPGDDTIKIYETELKKAGLPVVSQEGEE